MHDQGLARRLFMADWYADQHPEAAGDPFGHFIRFGLGCGFEPNPMFDTGWYGSKYGEHIPAGIAPFDDYVANGAAIGRDPGPLFDTQWYLTRNPDVAAAGMNALEHYLTHGSHEARDPSPLFDSAWYFRKYSVARATGLDARAHYMAQGHKLGYSPGPFFDAAWYLSAYPEVAATGANPLLHYLLRGADAGFNPSADFDTASYVVHNPEALMTGKNPLVHWLVDEERRRQSSLMPNTAENAGPSQAAVAQIDALIELLAEIEPELAELRGQTKALPVHRSGMDLVETVWRGLYLSLYALPRRLIIVRAIDGLPAPFAAMAEAAGTLIVETDAPVRSIGRDLPRVAHWRALNEFGLLVDGESRTTVLTALVNNLQPEAALVYGSRSGWEMIARHGAALARRTALFAAAETVVNEQNPDLVRLHFRSCIPALTALYGSDAQAVAHLGSLFGLPDTQSGKLRPIEDWALPGGFLSPEGRA